MADIQDLIAVTEEYREICLAFNTEDVLDAAKNIAYYSAMIDAAEEDPLDDAEEQEDLLDYLKGEMKEYTEIYQRLINDLLP